MLTERAIAVANVLAETRVGITRADLVKRLDVSPPTLQRALAELRRVGWIGSDFKGGPPSGRMSGPLRLTRKAGLIVAVDVGRLHLRSVVCDLHGAELGSAVEADVRIDVEESGSELLRTVARTVMAALARASSAEEPYRLAEVRAIGVGVPSPVDAQGTIVGLFLPQWSGLPLPSILAGQLSREAEALGDALRPGVQIRIAKDADLGALITWQEHVELRLADRRGGSQRRVGGHTAPDEPAAAHAQEAAGSGRAENVSQESLVYVKASTRIDAGLICEGQRVVGTHGLAGQLGHIFVPNADGKLVRDISPRIAGDAPTERCPRCGRQTCLENLASGGAILKQLRRLEGGGDVPGSVEDLMMQFPSHRMLPLHHEAVIAAGARVGLVLADAARLADPTVIVVGGLMALAGDIFMTPLRVAFAGATFGGLEPKLIGVDPARVKRIELEGAIVLARSHLRFSTEEPA